MLSANAHDLICEIVGKNIGTLGVATLLSDVEGWDSLKTVRFVLRLEEVLGRQLSEAELEGLQSIGEVERLLGAV